MSRPTQTERAWARQQVVLAMDVLVPQDTRDLMDGLRKRTGDDPVQALVRTVRAGARVERLREEWLAGMRMLSPRLRQAALLMLEGRTYKGVALAMGLSHWTVHEYAERAVRAFGEPGRVRFWHRYCMLLEVYGAEDLTPAEEASA